MIFEKNAAMEEAAQFREDVACLVKETEKLLADIKNERHMRLVAEEDINRLTADLLNIEKTYPQRTNA